MNCSEDVVTITKGAVNSYLLRADGGFVLIDTGTPEKRGALEKELENADCRRGDLRLILLTHGDYDHAGSAAYLRRLHDAPVALHGDDAGRVERADWSWNLKPAPDRFAFPFNFVSRFIRPGEFSTFSPDILAEDGLDLSAYGLTLASCTFPGTRADPCGCSVPSGTCSAAISCTEWGGRDCTSSSTT